MNDIISEVILWLGIGQVSTIGDVINMFARLWLGAVLIGGVFKMLTACYAGVVSFSRRF